MKKIMTTLALVMALLAVTAGTASASTAGQRNALSSAQSYLRSSAFSKSGLVEQLEYEDFSVRRLAGPSPTYGSTGTPRRSSRPSRTCGRRRSPVRALSSSWSTRASRTLRPCTASTRRTADERHHQHDSAGGRDLRGVLAADDRRRGPQHAERGWHRRGQRADRLDVHWLDRRARHGRITEHPRNTNPRRPRTSTWVTTSDWDDNDRRERLGPDGTIAVWYRHRPGYSLTHHLPNGRVIGPVHDGLANGVREKMRASAYLARVEKPAVNDCLAESTRLE